MIQGFSVIRHSRLEYNKGLFTYDVSRQGGKGSQPISDFSDKGGGLVGEFLCSKIFEPQPRTFY